MGVYRVGDIWYMCFTDSTGKRVRKTTHSSSKTEARAMLDAIRTDIRRGEYKFVRNNKLKFEDYAEEYIKHEKKEKKSWSLKNLKAFFKGMEISKINTKQIEDYKLKRLQTVSPATTNRELACLKHMYAKALDWNYTHENPASRVKLLKEPVRDMKILSREQMKMLIDAALEPVKTIITVALNTGMRKGEILKLRWQDVDLKKMYLSIPETKSDKPRKVPVNSILANALNKVKHENKYIFYNGQTNTRLMDIRKQFINACNDAEIDSLHFHDLRHTAATYMVLGGIDIATVSKILGHSDIKMTMRYTHPTPESKRRAVDVLAALQSDDPEGNVIILSQQGREESEENAVSNLISNN